jgi:hypothetical protein
MKKIKNKNKYSFFGFIIVLVIILVFLYLIYNMQYSKKVDSVNFINNYYNIYSERLVPNQYMNYIIDLQKLDIPEITDPIIEYVYLYQNSLNISYQINSEKYNDCITNNLKNKMRVYNNSKKELLKKFEDFSIKPKGVYWHKYIENLKDIESNKLEEELKQIQSCN